MREEFTDRRRGGPGRYLLHPQGPVVTRRRVGDARPAGRLLRPEGRFHLAAGLNAAGAMSVADAVDLACNDISAQAAAQTISVDLADGYVRHIKALGKYAAARGRVHVASIDLNLIVEWLHAPVKGGQAPSANTRQIRRSAARAWFITLNRLGIDDRNPAKAIEEQRKYERYTNALTDTQVDQLKDTARHRVGETMVPAAVALAILGAATGEIAEITVGAVNLEEGWVDAPGIPSRIRPRRLPVDDEWAAAMLRLRLAALTDDQGRVDPSQRLTYQGTAAAAAKRTAATSNLLAQALKRARLHNPGVTRAASINEYVAARVFRITGSVEAVANRLGLSSLDGAAHLVSHQWTADPTPLPGGGS